MPGSAADKTETRRRQSVQGAQVAPNESLSVPLSMAGLTAQEVEGARKPPRAVVGKGVWRPRRAIRVALDRVGTGEAAHGFQGVRTHQRLARRAGGSVRRDEGRRVLQLLLAGARTLRSRQRTIRITLALCNGVLGRHIAPAAAGSGGERHECFRGKPREKAGQRAAAERRRSNGRHRQIQSQRHTYHL